MLAIVVCGCSVGPGARVSELGPAPPEGWFSGPRDVRYWVMDRRVSDRAMWAAWPLELTPNMDGAEDVENYRLRYLYYFDCERALVVHLESRLVDERSGQVYPIEIEGGDVAAAVIPGTMAAQDFSVACSDRLTQAAIQAFMTGGAKPVGR